MTTLTQEQITKAWQKYCKAANRHGMPPKLDKVLKDIAEHGVFEIRTGSEENWTTKFQINEQGECKVIPNFTIPTQSHKQKVKQIVEEFES